MCRNSRSLNFFNSVLKVGHFLGLNVKFSLIWLNVFFYMCVRNSHTLFDPDLQWINVFIVWFKEMSAEVVFGFIICARICNLNGSFIYHVLIKVLKLYTWLSKSCFHRLLLSPTYLNTFLVLHEIWVEAVYDFLWCEILDKLLILDVSLSWIKQMKLPY